MVAAIHRHATVLGDVPWSRSVRRPDPKDDPILAIAVVGDAELLVSGDKSDMLALDHVDPRGIPIRSPREALAIALTTEADGDS